ncbi:permease prefix domain 1-containing protein [Actinomyces oricola]
MDAIDTFLTAMFAPYPSTARLLEAKGELRAMMEDAYNDALAQGRSHNEAVGQVITDFGNLEELAPVLGIVPDLHAAQSDNAAPQPGPGSYSEHSEGTAPQGGGAAPHPEGGAYQAFASDGPAPVTIAEAQEFAEAYRRTGSALGRAIALFVIAGAPLIALTSADNGRNPWGLDEDVATGVGLLFALPCIAVGVLLMIRRSQAFAGVQRLRARQFLPNPVVTAWAARLRAEHEAERSRRLSLAVLLWVLAVLPPVLSSLVFSSLFESLRLEGMGIALSLILVAAGLYLFLPSNWAAATYELLTQNQTPSTAGADTSRANASQSNPVIGMIGSVYWPLCTVIYLVWSFLGNAWDTSWILWPVAGILFGALAAVSGSWRDWRAWRHDQGRARRG